MLKNIAHQTRITIIVITVVVLVLIGLVVYEVRKVSAENATGAGSVSAVRDDSHRLNPGGDDKVTLVEFLDFECEACGAAYPVIEDLRETYGDRVSFVVRYFPIDSHANARNAAHAVEAAARQNMLEPMYKRMFDTQIEWGESQKSQADRFRGYAEDLGLDLEQYDRDVVSPEVAERVQSDVDDGMALGVSGTPTFFLNGERLEPQSTEDFTTAIEDALAG